MVSGMFFAPRQGRTTLSSVRAMPAMSCARDATASLFRKAVRRARAVGVRESLGEGKPAEQACAECSNALDAAARLITVHKWMR